jgi:hypothetical protein
VQLALGKSKTEKGIIQSAWRRVGTILSELTAIAQKEVLLYFIIIIIVNTNDFIKLTSMERTKLETLITIQVHQRDVLDELMQHKVKVSNHH